MFYLTVEVWPKAHTCQDLVVLVCQRGVAHLVHVLLQAADSTRHLARVSLGAQVDPQVKRVVLSLRVHLPQPSLP